MEIEEATRKLRQGDYLPLTDAERFYLILFSIICVSKLVLNICLTRGINLT